MANEIQFSASLGVTNGNLQSAQAVTKQANQTTPGAVQRKQTIATGGSTITLTGVTTPRAIIIENKDASNYVDIGPDSSGMVAAVRLQPGEVCLLPLYPGVVLKAQAHTASVDIEFFIIET